jgi:hypothetical protein
MFEFFDLPTCAHEASKHCVSTNDLGWNFRLPAVPLVETSSFHNILPTRPQACRILTFREKHAALQGDCLAKQNCF